MPQGVIHHWCGDIEIPCSGWREYHAYSGITDNNSVQITIIILASVNSHHGTVFPLMRGLSPMSLVQHTILLLCKIYYCCGLFCGFCQPLYWLIKTNLIRPGIRVPQKPILFPLIDRHKTVKPCGKTEDAVQTIKAMHSCAYQTAIFQHLL